MTADATGPAAGPAADVATLPDPVALLRSPAYLRLLVLAALVGAPVSALSYGFLKLVALLQEWAFTSLPRTLGFAGAPWWWPLPLVAAAGVLVSLTIVRLPGGGGHEPADGFQFGGGGAAAAELPGIFLAALTTLALGVVLGPEAPLIALGGGLGVLATRLAARDAPPAAGTVMAAAGSFAAVSTLLGSPVVSAFLLMEVVGIGGPLLGLVLVPGLLAAGIGTLVFVGLNDLTGFGTFSLAIPGLPPFDRPTVALLLWAVAFGALLPVLGTAIRLAGLALRSAVAGHRLAVTPLLGLAVAAVAVGFGGLTGRGSSVVLFSGQDALPALVLHASTWTVGALVLLAGAKSLAYTLSLSGFRGGPIFPAMFIGAAVGVAASHLPGMLLVPGVAMGIAAMTTVMLKLPLTATLLSILLLGSDGLALAPLVIVAVVVAYVVSARLPQTADELGRRRPAAAPAAPAGEAGSAGAGVPPPAPGGSGT